MSICTTRKYMFCVHRKHLFLSATRIRQVTKSTSGSIYCFLFVMFRRHAFWDRVWTWLIPPRRRRLPRHIAWTRVHDNAQSLWWEGRARSPSTRRRRWCPSSCWRGTRPDRPSRPRTCSTLPVDKTCRFQLIKFTYRGSVTQWLNYCWNLTDTFWKASYIALWENIKVSKFW